MYSITEQVLAWLRGLGHEARTYPSADMEPPFATVERTGGHVEDMVDHPSVAIQAWGSTEAEAEAMALAIRDAALLGPRPHGVTAMAVNSGPYPFWDEETRLPRYQLVLDIACIVSE